MSIVKQILMLVLFSGTLLLVFLPREHHDMIFETSKPVADAILSSNQYTQAETDMRVADNPYVTLEERYERVTGNDVFELYADDNDLSLRIRDLRSGYLWGTSFFIDYDETDDDDNPLYPELYDEDDRGFKSRTWRAKAISPVWIGYYVGSDDSPQFREESLFESDMSRVTYTQSSDGFVAGLYFGFSGIRMTLVVSLTEKGLDVSIPFDSIEDNEDARLSRVSVYPLMGAVKTDRIPGYIMVPDGIGALIRFDQAESFTSIFEKPFYGYDPANSREITATPESINEEKSLYANTYGMVHGVGQNGYLAIVGSGAPYASLIIYPAKVTTDFFFAYANFTYRTVYRQPLNQSQTNTIVKLQKDANPFDLDLTYVFLNDEEADYVGMATAYRNDLIDEGLIAGEVLDTAVSLHLDVIAADNKKALLGVKTVLMTDIASLSAMIGVLSDVVGHLAVTYRGYGKGGLGGSSLNEVPFDPLLGSKDEIRTLNENYDIYHVVEPTKGYPGTPGYNPYDLAIQRNLQNISLADSHGQYYLMHPAESLKRAKGMKDDFEALAINHVAFQSIGHLAYGTHGDESLSRQETIDQYRDLVSLFQHTAIFDPMAFMMISDIFFDVVLYSSQRSIYSDTVPFLTYVMKGMRPLYGRYGNFFANTQNELLRLIDYGVYPSFVVTEASAYGFLDTSSEEIHTSEFAIWQDEIIRQYAYVNGALQYVTGQTIVSRTIVGPGVVIVQYNHGVSIGINYSMSDYTGVMDIPAGGFALGGVA